MNYNPQETQSLQFLSALFGGQQQPAGGLLPPPLIGPGGNWEAPETPYTGTSRLPGSEGNRSEPKEAPPKPPLIPGPTPEEQALMSQLSALDENVPLDELSPEEGLGIMLSMLFGGYGGALGMGYAEGKLAKNQRIQQEKIGAKRSEKERLASKLGLLGDERNRNFQNSQIEFQGKLSEYNAKRAEEAQSHQQEWDMYLNAVQQYNLNARDEKGASGAMYASAKQANELAIKLGLEPPFDMTAVEQDVARRDSRFDSEKALIDANAATVNALLSFKVMDAGLGNAIKYQGLLLGAERIKEMKARVEILQATAKLADRVELAKLNNLIGSTANAEAKVALEFAKLRGQGDGIFSMDNYIINLQELEESLAGEVEIYLNPAMFAPVPGGEALRKAGLDAAQKRLRQVRNMIKDEQQRRAQISGMPLSPTSPAFEITPAEPAKITPSPKKK